MHCYYKRLLPLSTLEKRKIWWPFWAIRSFCCVYRHSRSPCVTFCRENYQPGINGKHIAVLTTLHQWPFLLFCSNYSAILITLNLERHLPTLALAIHRCFLCWGNCIPKMWTHGRVFHSLSLHFTSPSSLFNSRTGFAAKWSKLFHFAGA